MSISNPSTDSETADGFVVPPHQEAVIGRLLNPESLASSGWTLARSTIEANAIHGYYRSRQGEPAHLTLAHPAAAPAAWKRTDHFALALQAKAERDAVAALARCLIAGIRAHEDSFRWSEVRPSPSETTTSSASPSIDSKDERSRGREAEGEIDLHLDLIPFIDLKLEFDHAGALAEALALRDRFVAYQSDPSYGVSGWRGLALQALDGDSARAATTETDPRIYEDQSRYRLTEIAERCPISLGLLERVLDLNHCRTVAFLLLEPGARITVHVDGDGPRVMRSLNVALNMPPGCVLTIDCNADGSDNPYTRRAPFQPGKALMLNVAKHHYVVNDSSEPRIHIVSRGSLRIPASRILALAEDQNHLKGRSVLEAALAEKRRVLSAGSPGEAQA